MARTGRRKTALALAEDERNQAVRWSRWAKSSQALAAPHVPAHPGQAQPTCRTRCSPMSTSASRRPRTSAARSPPRATSNTTARSRYVPRSAKKPFLTIQRLRQPARLTDQPTPSIGSARDSVAKQAASFRAQPAGSTSRRHRVVNPHTVGHRELEKPRTAATRRFFEAGAAPRRTPSCTTLAPTPGTGRCCQSR